MKETLPYAPLGFQDCSDVLPVKQHPHQCDNTPPDQGFWLRTSGRNREAVHFSAGASFGAAWLNAQVERKGVSERLELIGIQFLDMAVKREGRIT